jgi:hypothetical protein
MLIFPLKKEWYEKIKNGEKTVEYRKVKTYWTKRIAKELFRSWFTFHSLEEVSNIISVLGFKKKLGVNSCILKLGYTRKKITANISLIEVVDGKNTDLHIDSPVYAIHLVNIKEYGNTKD